MLDFKIGGIVARRPVSTPTPHDPNHPKIKRVEVYWHTVTYKTVAVYTLLLAAIILAAVYLINPNLYTQAYDKFNKSLGNGDVDAVAISQMQVYTDGHFAARHGCARLILPVVCRHASLRDLDLADLAFEGRLQAQQPE